MAPRDATGRLPPAASFAPILLANLVPLVGVLEFGWDPATLVVIYALEVLLAFPLAAGKALFAGKPPNVEELETDDEDGDESSGDSSVVSIGNTDLARKRGSVRLVSWLPPVYPRNVPFIGAVLFATVWSTLFIVALLSEVAIDEALARPEVWLSVGALLSGQLIETWRDYLRGGRYEETSPYAVIETPARQAFFLIFVLFIVAEASGAIVLAAFVAVKLLVDWSAFRATNGGGGRLTGWLSGPDGEDESDETGEAGEAGETTANEISENGERLEPLSVPDGEPDTRVSTHTPTVVLTGILHTLVKPAPFYTAIVILAWFITLAVLGGTASGGFAVALTVGISFLALAALAGYLTVKTLEHILSHAPLEYHRYDDRLVAYDTWVEEPQWQIPLHEIRDVRLVTDRYPDRVYDTRTLEAQMGWGDDEATREIGPVVDADAFAEALDLPIRGTVLELQPIDRRIAAIAVAPLGGLLIGAVAVVVGPWPLLVALPYVIFGLPFIALVLHGLWRQAYPDPDPDPDPGPE
ncbi:uncharacterized protein Nmag_2217 [Natrialba magadii ATCC 43099]|uniref:Uncharacterized protein n=1 Tax=Natrialba magadii (strain ATCC 43099 / DSM 3394 / CCM 3739 / CIP 104546 / IAM 13178 / JCM 8861 / NBRC 102185 / NCIMB 2190 / MS3) TaxID=547559 RepID=D3SWQ2_NATMM|nr:DUF6498-containing protein [Natrialba magadii]ADD05784.1 uncharacterized protein Nmag_2217 [Natrialba magadii ATCC 43099]